MPIDKLQGGVAQGGGFDAALRSATTVASGGGGFAEALQGLVKSVEESSAGANAAVTGMLDKTNDVHDAMVALQRAEMALELTVQVRNKLVAAYQDVMRMPV
ncbi:MAG: flagellar hook-basal body complex protein FliE [Vicinamibacterales bacterium]